MESAPQKVDTVVSLVIRLLVSLVLPLWGLAMLALGAIYPSAWWIVSGVSVCIIGAVTFVSGPLVDFRLGER